MIAWTISAPRLGAEMVRRDIITWGDGSYGQLGDGGGNNPNMFYNSSKPTEAAAEFEAIAIAAGEKHNLALDTEGNVWAWGANEYFQLGDGSSLSATVPRRVVDLEDAVAIDAGAHHSLAIKSGGGVWAWGWGQSGQLGDGSFRYSLTPVAVNGLSNAVAVSAGDWHSLALADDGSVWAWGEGTAGQLGNRDTRNVGTPVQISGLTGVVGIAAGAYHSLAVKSDGTVWAWGEGGDGQLGNSPFADATMPVQVSAVTNVVAVAAGSGHSLALTSDGTIWSWGLNGYGQSGHDVNGAAPLDRPESYVAIAAGTYHSLAIRSDGTVSAWGLNGTNQLAASGIGDAVAIGAGRDHSIALGRLPSGECYEGVQVHEGSVLYSDQPTNELPLRAGARDRVYLEADESSLSMCFRLQWINQTTPRYAGGKMSISLGYRPDPMNPVTFSNSDLCNVTAIDQSSLGNRVVLKISDTSLTICVFVNSSWTSITISSFETPAAPIVLTRDP